VYYVHHIRPNPPSRKRRIEDLNDNNESKSLVEFKIHDLRRLKLHRRIPVDFCCLGMYLQVKKPRRCILTTSEQERLSLGCHNLPLLETPGHLICMSVQSLIIYIAFSIAR
jgi:hypothetical protein